MSNTYSQIHIQIVFAVKGRQNLVSRQYREEIHKYITGIVQQRNQKMLAIFCMPDHLHLLIGLRPIMALADLVRDIKASSSNFIKSKGWIRGEFCWQEGFGAFSYSQSQVHTVIQYILNQEEHHQKTSFREEYYQLLREFEIEFNDRYLFDWGE
jgi:REP element-mobilizing transposase RayT